MRLNFLLLSGLFLCAVASAQETGTIAPIICWTNGDVATEASDVTYGVRPKSFPNSEFELLFSGTVPSEARASIRAAADIWQEFLRSDVPIRVNVDWIDQMSESQLASAGPAQVVRAFEEVDDPEVWYPIALGRALAGFDLIEDDSIMDIDVVVNSEADWNFELTGAVPRDKIDLATVILHELCHGLGFFSSIYTIDDTTATIGLEDDNGPDYPVILDNFLVTPTGEFITDTARFTRPSVTLLAAVVDRLKFGGPNAVRENGGEDVPLFAPATFDIGSSVSHLNERAYRRGTPNALMTPSIAFGERIRDPGPVTLGLLEDLGWNVVYDPSPVHEIVAGQLRPYPNPTSNSFILPLDAVEAPSLVVLYGMDGREVRRQAVSIQQPTAEINVSGLPTGMYSLVVQGGKRSYSGRILVR